MAKRNQLVLLILLTLFIFPIKVNAENLSELQDRKSVLKEAIDEKNEQKEEINIELTETLKQVESLDTKIQEYQSKIDELQEKLKTTQENIKETKKKLEIIEENYILQKEALAKRLVALYESGEIRYLDFLLSSNSLSEFISNYYLIAEIAKYDTNLLENIDRQRKEIENAKELLELKESNIKSLKKTQETTAVALNNARIIKNSYANQLTAEELATQEKINEYTKELNEIEAQIDFLTVGKIGKDYVGGEFAWPAPGYYTITSPFGMRMHPVLKVYRLHTGTDIGAPMYSKVVATNDGIVTSAVYSSSYGNMVIVDHGGGITTLYAHGSQILVEKGQTVNRGDIIMLSGSTGWSTGPHLHFEIRINGKYVDPLPYITRKSKIEDKQETSGKENEGIDGGENE